VTLRRVLVEISVTEQRYRAVLEVRAGSTVTDVAARFGVSRQAVHRLLAWYDEHGLAGLASSAGLIRAGALVGCCSSCSGRVALGRFRRGSQCIGSWSGMAWSMSGLAVAAVRTTGGGSVTVRWSCGRWTSWVGSA
jgi:hypothetical protein